MYCPNCGTPNTEVAHFCEKCGMALTAAPPPMPPPAPGAPVGPVGNAVPPDRGMGGVGAAAMPQQAPPQQNWQAPPNQQAWQAPPNQQAWQTPPQGFGGAQPNIPGGKRYAVGKDATLAMILSIFLSPVGQFYNGDIKKGLAFLGGYLLGGILTLVGVGVGYFLILALWIWSVVDAYNVAKQKSPLW